MKTLDKIIYKHSGYILNKDILSCPYEKYKRGLAAIKRERAKLASAGLSELMEQGAEFSVEGDMIVTRLGTFVGKMPVTDDLIDLIFTEL